MQFVIKLPIYWGKILDVSAGNNAISVITAGNKSHKPISELVMQIYALPRGTGSVFSECPTPQQFSRRMLVKCLLFDLSPQGACVRNLVHTHNAELNRGAFANLPY